MDRPEYKYFKEEQEEKQSNKIFYKFVIVLCVIYALVFGVTYAFRSTFEYVTINGCSMQSTLNPNPVKMNGKEVQDGVYIKLTQNVDYGDIIIIKKDKQDSIIKRALAFGGDYITIASVEYDEGTQLRFMRVKDGSDEVEVVDEKNYIKSYDEWNATETTFFGDVEYEDVFYSCFTFLGYKTKEIEVELDGTKRSVVFFQIPEDEVFFMGDNRTGSADARVTGTVDKKDVVGYVVKIVHNGTITKKNPIKWFFQQIGDFFSIVWNEIF